MSPEVTPLSILTSVRDSLVAEIASTRAPDPVVLRRDIAVLVTAALSEVMESLDALEQSCAATTRVLAALEACEGEVLRLRGQAAAITGAAVRGAAHGNVVDLSEILGRVCARVRPGTGGDAV